MSIEKPDEYRSITWDAVSSALSSLSEQQVRDLARRAGVENDDQTLDELLEELVYNRSWFLLLELGLTSNPEMMIRSLFSIGGLEFVIEQEGVEILKSKAGHARLPIIGGGKSRNFSYQELIRALSQSHDFDQLRLRPHED